MEILDFWRKLPIYLRIDREDQLKEIRTVLCDQGNGSTIIVCGNEEYGHKYFGEMLWHIFKDYNIFVIDTIDCSGEDSEESIRYIKTLELKLGLTKKR